MKTRSRDSSSSMGLPPPPAPPARDANPWRMPQGDHGRPGESRQAPAPAGLPPRRLPRPLPADRRRNRRWAPLLILFFVAGTAVQLAVRALREGDVEAAVVAVVMLAMVAIVVVRRLRKRKD